MTGTPVDLGRLLDVGHPIRHATYELREMGRPDLAGSLEQFVQMARDARSRHRGSKLQPDR